METEHQQSPAPSSYLWFGIVLVLVVVKLLALEHEVALLPVLDDGALLLQPARLQGPLQRVGGARPGARGLPAHHALGPRCQGKRGLGWWDTRGHGASSPGRPQGPFGVHRRAQFPAPVTSKLAMSL